VRTTSILLLELSLTIHSLPSACVNSGRGRRWLPLRVKQKGLVTHLCDVLLTVANFAAYTFAPAILVTPLGALSVIIGCAKFFHVLAARCKY
jgi:hypothetical protein